MVDLEHSPTSVGGILIAHLRRFLLTLFAVLLVSLISGGGATGQEQAVDFWQFPKLSQSKAFQRWWWAFQQRAYPLGDIPKDALLRAQRQIEETKVGLSPTSQSVQGSTWMN